MDFDINDEVKKILGSTNSEEMMTALSETLAEHPEAYTVVIVYDEEAGYFEMLGTEVPAAYAIGLLHAGIDSLMTTWFPHEEEED